jgi:rsbT co-antagonist protein RsbR
LEEGAQGSEIERLRAEVEALKQTLEERERTEAALKAEVKLLRSAFDHLPVAVALVDRAGQPLLANERAQKIASTFAEASKGELPPGIGFFLSDKVTPAAADELPITRALSGDVVRGEEVFLRDGDHPEGQWLEIHAAPARDESGAMGAVSMFIDCGARKSLEEQVAARNEELVTSETEKNELISRLRMAVQELSTPILELWEDVLALPVIGVVDSRRSAEMMERLLDEVVRSQARFVIIDLTGVEVIDTQTADHFMKLVKAVGLIGARCVLTGIRPAVAQTLVDLDVDFGSLATLRNLKHGLRQCQRWLDAEDAEQSVSAPRRAQWS